ncbi:MAG: hypothetical protein QCI82_02475 [Candidatus Thermoplasmatota archaeon]|nr:hypothetical protein [Candidatus Thermoplasmatota archaeon]
MEDKEKSEKLLTLGEVREFMELTKDLPTEIYSGPEKDSPDEFDEFEGASDVEKPAEELSFEKRATMDVVNAFCRIEKDRALAMIEELCKLERITDAHAYKIAELMPRDEAELRPVFAKERFTLEPEELKELLSIIDKHRI